MYQILYLFLRKVLGDAGNYMAVSLTCVTGKLTETKMKETVIKALNQIHCDRSNIL